MPFKCRSFWRLCVCLVSNSLFFSAWLVLDRFLSLLCLRPESDCLVSVGYLSGVCLFGVFLSVICLPDLCLSAFCLSFDCLRCLSVWSLSVACLASVCLVFVCLSGV